MPHTRADVVQAFLNLFDNPEYLEIGVNQGETFHALQAGRKVAVDPRFAFEQEARQPGAEYHEVTSDHYFGSIHDGRKFDVIYIDGLHTFEQTLKDLLSAQLVLKERGIIVVDDVIPNSFDASLPDLAQVFELRSRTREVNVRWETDGSWMGDVYKVVFFVEQFMQQMSFATVAENHGQSVLWRHPRRAEDLPNANYEAIARFDFRDTVLRRSSFRLRPLDEIVAELAKEGERHPRLVNPPTPTYVDLPQNLLISSVEFPAKSLQEPRVSFPELMPGLIKDFQSNVWGKTRAPKTAKVHRLENVCVVGQGVVFNQNGEIFAQTTNKMSDSQVGVAVKAFQAGLMGEIRRRQKGPYLLCGQAGIPNYGHWMVEILPTAFFMQQEVPDQPWTAYIPEMFPSTASVVRESFDLLGINASRRMEGDGQPVWFDELIVVTGLSQHGLFLLPVSTMCLQSMAKSIESDESEKIWISRLGQKRALSCEAELNKRLTALGWRVLLPGQMSLKAQIAACKGAVVMAGIDGAGLTNMAFMPTGGRVTSFRPAQMPDTFFYELAANGALSYHDVCCLTSEPEGDGIPWDVELQLSADEVLDLLV